MFSFELLKKVVAIAYSNLIIIQFSLHTVKQNWHIAGNLFTVFQSISAFLFLERNWIDVNNIVMLGYDRDLIWK